MQKVQAGSANETRTLDLQRDAFLYVGVDTFHLFLQLRHRLHQVLRVVAPQVLENSWYWVRLGLYSNF